MGNAAERMIEKHYVKDAEIMSELSNARRVPQLKGSVASDVKRGKLRAVTGRHKQ